jgi:hypothetical protein
LAFVQAFMDCGVPRIAIENPVGCISSRIRKPDQIVQPWMFGDDASKATCLWLSGLPTLHVTRIVPPKGWGVVRYAVEMDECECCGEPWCPWCEAHYGDCECIGPCEDESVKRVINGVEFGCRLENPPKPVWSNQTASGQNRLGPSEDRWKERSRTYAGVAAAMAEQWG